MTIRVRAAGLLLGIAATFLPSIAQNFDDRVVLVRDIYRDLNEALERSHTYQLEAASEVVRSNGGQRDTLRSRISVIADSLRARMVTSDAELLQDGSATVVILPASHMILIRSAADGSRIREMAQHIMAVRDTLFTRADVKGCDTIIENGRRLQRISIGFDQKSARAANLRMAAFTIDIDARKLKRLHIDFATGTTLSMDLVVERIAFDGPATWFSGSAMSQVMTPENQLRPEYEGYTVFDRRTESQKRIR